MTDGTSGRTTWSITNEVPTVWANQPGLSVFLCAPHRYESTTRAGAYVQKEIQEVVLTVSVSYGIFRAVRKD